MVQDLRFAARTLLARPGLAFLSVVAIALGIGFNTAVFSVVNAVLLRPLPYEEPGRLVSLWDSGLSGLDRRLVSPSNFVDWQRETRAFDGLDAYTESFFNLADATDPVERVYGLEATPGFFATLGVRPMLGRGFRPEDSSHGQAGNGAPILISHDLWQRRFGSDPTVVGRLIALNETRAEVVGVLPADFWFSTQKPEVFRPLAFTQDQIQNWRARRWLSVVGRLKPGFTVEQAQAGMDAVTARLAEQSPAVNHGRAATVRSLQDEVVGKVRPALLILQGAVGLVLLIASANVANLQLARGLSRRHEMATRVALGASRARLVRHLLAESLMLGITGAAMGVVLASWCMSLLVALSPTDIPRINTANLDGHVLAFAFLLAVFTSVLFGLVPAHHASTPNLQTALKEGGNRAVGMVRPRAAGALVILEVALSLVLLIGAGLLVKSFARLQRVDPGFLENEAIAMDVSLGAGYGEPGARARFFEELIARVEASPGIRSAGVTKDLPLSGEASSRGFTLVGPTSASATEAGGDAQCRRVSAHYFDAMGIALRNGRGFDVTDTPDTPGVVIANDAFVRTFLAGQEPIGKQLIIQDGPPRERRIIGVARDVKHFGLDVAAVPELYIPHVDRPWPNMTLVVRATSGDPRMVLPHIRRELGALDKSLPLANVRTIRDYVAASTGGQRFSMRLVGGLAALALLLAALGVYAVMAYTVAQRTQEIGVRMALGADTSAILRLILRDGLRQVWIGLAIGLAGALALGRTMTHMLYDVSAVDPVVLVGVAALLTGVALLACYVPARRASELEPAVTTRL